MASLRSRLASLLDRSGLRFWGVVLPIHVVGFLVLYLGTFSLLEHSFSRAGAAAARRLLDEAVAQMPDAMPLQGRKTDPHLFGQLIAAHRPIGLRVYGPTGAPVEGTEATRDADDTERARRLLASPTSEDEVWVENVKGIEWVRGVVRLRSTGVCDRCHVAGATLGVATMRLDYTEEFAEIRRVLRRRVLLLLACWAFIVGGVALLVQWTVRRSLSALETDLAAASAGRAPGGAAPEVFLDRATARLHHQLGEHLRRRREQDAQVISRLVHADQLASLGQLAAGLAHEIKNPLAGIQGAIEVLKHETTDESTTHLYDEMLDELRRVNGILQRLLESGRPSPLHPVPTDVGRLIRDTVDLMRPALSRRRIELSADVAEGLEPARLDPAKIRQVLVNLITNAGEAIAERGGHVVVRAVPLPDGGVVLSVEDDGPGISPQVLSRLFEPFFTTKFTGTGLGLSISKSLVEQHGGRISVDSQPERGVTFFAFLPAQRALEPVLATEGAA